MTDLPEHVRRNRDHWDQLATTYVAAGERAWANNAPSWGIWSVPESEVGMFPDDLVGRDVIELGCGTAYVSSWLARRGARVIGIDNSEQQLATARRLQREHGLDFPLIHGNAETVPYRDASFDFAISEYGACGPIRSAGCLRQRGYCAQEGDFTSSSMPSCSRCVCHPKTTSPQAIGCCARHLACIESSGGPTIASSFISRTATGSGCCEHQDSRSKT
jgi:SAM-dependent methyltransferase